MRRQPQGRNIRKNIKPFKLLSNVTGQVENKAERFMTMNEAVAIQNMHSTEEGSWTADSIGYVPTNFATFTADAGTDVLTSAGHGFVAAYPIVFQTTDTLPGGLVAGTTYYAGNITTDTFKAYTDSSLSSLVNITSAGSGTHRVRGVPFESGANVDGMAQYTDSASVDHLMIAINGKLKEVSTSTGLATDIDAAAGYTVGNQVDFEQFRGKLYSCDGAIVAPRKWDGATAADAAGWPVNDGTNTYSKPKFIEQHQDRILTANFQGGTNGPWPSHFILSDISNGESHTLPAVAAGHAYIGRAGVGDGQEIRAAKVMPMPGAVETGQNLDITVLYKDKSCYTVTGGSAKAGDADEYVVSKISSQYGAFNNRCVVQVGIDLLAFNEFGISSFTVMAQSGTIQPIGINSDLVKDTIASLNYSARLKCWVQHLPNRREVWFGLPTGASSVVNKIIVYKYPDPGDPRSLPKFSIRTDAGVFKPACGLFYQNQHFYVGLNNGIVARMFSGSKYDNTGIPWRYEYPYFDAGNPDQIKALANGDSLWKVRSNQEITIRTQWRDGGNNQSFDNNLTITTNTTGALYGHATYGVDFYGTTKEAREQYKAPGNGTALKHSISGTTTESGPEFLGLIPVFEFGNQVFHYR